MPNTAALIRESIWRNKEFRSLPRSAQCTYVQLCSQKDLDCAGLLTLNIAVLAKGCDEIDQTIISDDLETLEAARFVFVDDDTDELFIRSYMRTAEVTKSPNIFKSALKSCTHVESPKLRVEVATELRRLHRIEADRIAEQLNPSGNHRPEPTNPSGTLPKFGTLSEPSSTSTSTGTVTGTSSPTVVGNGGEGHLRPRCPTHPDGNADMPCRACQARRRFDENHDAQTTADELEHRRAAKTAQAAAQAACTHCDAAGWRLAADNTPVEPAIRCTHPGAGTATSTR